MTAPAPDGGMRLTAHEMVALAQRHMRLETEGNVDGVMATLTSDVTWGTPATELHVGADEVRKHYEESILPPGRFTVENFRGWADYEHQEAVGLWDVRPPGSPASYPVVAIFSFRDGLISGERLFHDGSAAGCNRGR